MCANKSGRYVYSVVISNNISSLLTGTGRGIKISKYPHRLIGVLAYGLKLLVAIIQIPHCRQYVPAAKSFKLNPDCERLAYCGCSVTVIELCVGT